MNFGARRTRRPVVAERSVRLMDRREVIAVTDKVNVVYHGNSRGDNFGEEENLAVRKELEARVRANPLPTEASEAARVAQAEAREAAAAATGKRKRKKSKKLKRKLSKSRSSWWTLFVGFARSLYDSYGFHLLAVAFATKLTA